ncbi:hypothetical protein SARC_04860 [Sphaeroforma arctica JP610]|uniref:Uncharacterized protein n=1 Tax=Sphaeroforma arctica JP610 TaxID=667725 RepID=A0A0L0G188_9EUKA|nr:hypothetical protein SARC_04860 [Sphaeroforma arctica JP610]KNC82860.1 hypothetical protein SARC_04860 [Sphaeroforma arctica JP610]|eukprot:XP_014156762.1 hypothetical protein SARC_04860 [Sphaeroforma arctica JP610]
MPKNNGKGNAQKDNDEPYLLRFDLDRPIVPWAKIKELVRSIEDKNAQVDEETNLTDEQKVERAAQRA